MAFNKQFDSDEDQIKQLLSQLTSPLSGLPEKVAESASSFSLFPEAEAAALSQVPQTLPPNANLDVLETKHYNVEPSKKDLSVLQRSPAVVSEVVPSTEVNVPGLTKPSTSGSVKISGPATPRFYNTGAVAPGEDNVEDRVKEYIKKIYGDQYSDAALTRAQESRDRLQAFATLGQAGNIIGSAVAGSGVKPITEPFDAMTKQAEQGVQDIKLGREGKIKEIETASKVAELYDKEAMRDPKNPISVSARKLVSDALGYKLPDTVSAEYLIKLNPFLGIKLKQMEMQQRQREIADLKADRKAQEDFIKIGKILNPDLAPRGSTFGRNATVYANARRIEQLVEGRNLNDLQDTEIAEMAKSLDGLLSGGQPTVSGMKELLPKFLNKDLKAKLAYLTSEVKGSNGASFVKRMLETTEREKHLAEELIARTQTQLLVPYKHYAESRPVVFDDLLHSYNLPLSLRQRLTAPLDGSSKKASVSDEQLEKEHPGKVKEYMVRNPGVSESQARNILKARIYGR